MCYPKAQELIILRMRKKTNLSSRMERCAAILVENPEELRGKWGETFPQYEKIYVELGCGKGTFTVGTAEKEPEALLIAVERVPDAMVMAMEKAMDQGVENVRFVDMDAANMGEIFADGEIDRIYVNFCDPWPKSHDAKHRLTAPGFLRKYADALKIGGQLHFKTDNDPLFAWSEEKIREEEWDVSEVCRDLHKDGPNGIMTDYEAKFFAQGITINRLVGTRTEKTKDKKAGPAPRMYQAGIERPYRTSELFRAAEAREMEE